MKATNVIISVALAGLLFSCGGNDADRQMDSLKDASRQELVEAITDRDRLLVLVKEISESLGQIKRLESIMTVSAFSPDENNGRRKQILADINILKEKIRQRRQKLDSLEKELDGSAVYNRELKETIDVLRSQIDAQLEEIESLRKKLTDANERIGVLSNAVDSLNSEVSETVVERDAARKASARLENEMNVCYYVVASKKELKKHKIIESGFLRRTKFMKGDYDKGFFVISDKRTLHKLPLGSDRVKILTNHPETSYELTEANGEKTLRILDYDKFWSLTNYLVVQIE